MTAYDLSGALRRIRELERELAEALSDHDVGIRVHLNEVEQPFSLQRGGEGTQMRRAWELGQRLTRSEARCKELEPVVQAAVDWCEDGNECHFCGVNSDEGPHDHDDECPLGEYLKVQARAALAHDGGNK